MITRNHFVHTLAACAAGLLIGASATLAAGDDDGHHHGDMPMAGMPGHADDATRTVNVSMHDNYYDPESVEVTAGETIRFVVTNNGELVHEFNIGTAEMHAAHQEEMMMMVEHGVIEVDHINYDMMKMDMGDGKTMEHDDPNSALLEPGQSAEIVWKFPEAMAMEFACNVPGHYDAGMMGDITITP